MLNNPLAEQFRKYGFVHVPAAIAAQHIGEITPIVDRIFADWLTKHSDDYRTYQMINMHSLTHESYFCGAYRPQRTLLFNFIASDRLVDIIGQTVAEPLYFHSTQLFFNPVSPTKRSCWHRDIQYMGLSEAEQQKKFAKLLNLHARIPLIDENGFELVPATHRRWDSPLERCVRLELDGRRSDEALPGGRVFDLQAGDLLLFSAHMIHRGNYVRNHARKSFDILIGKIDASALPYLDRDNLPSDAELRCIDNPQWFRAAIAAMNETASP